jgi:AcrR family transcriptional regulator
MNNAPLTRQQRKRLRTRNQLKEAAMSLLLEMGYETMTIQHITDRADLGRGTFYLHFKDKGDVVWALIKDGIDVADRSAHQRMGIMDYSNSEYFGYMNMFRHASQNKDLYRVMLGSQGSSMLTSRVQDYMADELEKDMQKISIYSEFKGIPDKIVAQIVTGAVVRTIIWWLETPNEYSPDEMAAMLYESLHHKKPQAGH